ncbi:helix-turn-helix domain-containing protein [Paenibacillus sp. LMG 31456]|uniref:Helix-turn-helix domain-containing protein n=1 Tax=Paenibacillus foliorum TaxID=2654974 RepID=A0A972GTE4_9BACL|nr:helix-turn-helix domain-containing protein [Paenibacillus foliorum]NOU94094.1 helix-turn-helix domain-containing protein [Paenibacillus foliorum]
MQYKGSKITRIFLLPYLLVLLVPIMIGTLTYNKTISVIETETAKSNMTLLNQSKEIIDRRLDEVDRITQQITLDPNLITFQYIADPFEGSNTYRTIEMKKSLVNYNLFNHFIANYYVLFANSKLVMTPTEVYDLPTFYPNVLQYGKLDYTQWTQQFMGKYHTKTILPATAYTIDGKEQQMITYIQSLGYGTNSFATIVILIDNLELVKLLSGLDIADGGSAYIADKNGQIISFISNESRPFSPDLINFTSASGTIFPSAASNNMMTTYTTSAYNGWTYVVSQPAHIAFEKVNYIKNTILTIFMLSLTIGLIIAILMAYRSSKPIRFLVNTFESSGEEMGKHEKTKDAYQLIQAGISRLKNNNDALQQEMDKQRPMLRIAFFERLLKGEFSISDDNKLVMDRLGIDLFGETFVVAVLSLSDHNLIVQKEIQQDLDIKSLMIKDVISRISENVFFHAMNGNKVALIFSCRSRNLDDCKKLVDEFVLRMNREMHEQLYNPSIGVGNIYTSLEEISRSYQEAEQALDYKIWKAIKGMVWFSDLPQTNGSYYYPSDVELKLMNYIKAGNQTEVQKLFVEFYSENFDKRNLSSSMMKLLVYDIKGSIAKLVEQIVIDDQLLTKQLQALFAPFDHLEDVQEIFRSIERTCLHICEVVNSRKRSHNDQLLKGIIEMIHSHYHSPNFALLAISEKFHISEVYLSYFIKEQTGIIFTEYLEALRMEHAKKLLLIESYSVKDIAEKVGYNSSNTFCRAFKRIYGISTTEYKKTITANNL